MTIIVAILLATGLYVVMTSQIALPYKPAAMALRRRAPQKPSLTERVTGIVALKLLPLVSIDDPSKRSQIQDELRNLSSNDTPELFKAKAMTKAGLLAVSIGLVCIPISTFIGIALAAILYAIFYKKEMKRLDTQMHERRQVIERELPQLASTICQSLHSTRDVVSILSSYRKICGPALAGEIDHTINDMVTGNPERALKALEGRINSPQLSQLTRGLISVLRGEEQSIYFQVLAAEFRKVQDEEVSKALLKRPEQTHPYMAALFGCFALMIAASLGTYIMQLFKSFF